jgi:hypothetical protein
MSSREVDDYMQNIDFSDFIELCDRTISKLPPNPNDPLDFDENDNPIFPEWEQKIRKKYSNKKIASEKIEMEKSKLYNKWIININKINLFESFKKSYIDLKDKGQLYKFLREFINITSLSSTGGKAAKFLLPFINSRNEKQASDALDSIIENKEYDLLIGIILYGCSKQLQSAVNDKYSSTITSIINKSLSVKQLYLDAKIGKGLIKFGMRAMENSDFMIGTLNGIDSWSSRAISIYMKK